MNINQIAVSSLVLLLFGISGPTAYAVTEDDKITAADAASGDFFGFRVAVSGTTVLVGAHPDDDAGDSSGSSYVFDCSSFPCVQVSKLTASDAAAGDRFGFSVAVSGTTAVVGAFGNDDAGNNSGSAYYFNLTTCGAACTETGKLIASDTALADAFGRSVAVSGTTAVVGAIGDDDGGNDSGSAYYFDLSTCGAACTEIGKLTASDAVARDFFGERVAISGTTAVVGAPSILDSFTSGSGSAYYFNLTTCGAACTETGKLTASDAAAGDRFGHAVAVSGTTAVVGAFFKNAGGSDSGSAYYFDLSTCGAACTETGKLIASDATGNQFARGVGVNGTTAVVGASGKVTLPGIVSGSAYIFDLSTCGAACTETNQLTASDAADADVFGFSVAVSETTAVVGAHHNDDGGDNSGSAYVFELDVVNNRTILESATLGPSEFGGGLSIGDSVSNSIPGNRFSISERSQITAIGGHLNTYDGVNLFNRGSIWGAIIPMSDFLPAFDASEVEANALAHAIFEDDNPSSGDLREPVSLVLNPGDYALIFGGGGLFGTTGQAIMTTTDQVRLPGFSFFFWDGRPGNNVWRDGGTDQAPRFVVEGFAAAGAPSADAGLDQLVAVGSTVFLDGSASTDPDGDPLTFQWTLTSAPAGSGSVLFDADTVSPNFVPDFEGLYEASLLVSDTNGPGTSDNVEITAIPPEQFAEMEIDSASESVGDLVPDQFTTQGNQNALMNFLALAAIAIEEGDIAEAINKLQKALSRTDGCELRGAPDGNGPGRDWITDCTEQIAVYNLLSSALAALTL